MKTRKLCAVKKPIKSTSETAFQRAILCRGKCTISGLGEVSWLDIELPVNHGRKAGRGECIDLIGKCKKGYVLCELKFKKESSNSNSPHYAFDELERYCKQISENWEELDLLNLHHQDCECFSWEEISDDIKSGSIEKIIAANCEYWKYWLEHRENDPRCDVAYMKSQGYILCSLDVNGDYFDLQKKTNEYYLPKIEDQSWVILDDYIFNK